MLDVVASIPAVTCDPGTASGATIALTLGDPARLDALRRTALLDSPAEEAFDRLTRLATTVLGVPISLVTLVDEDRQFFKSGVGLPGPAASARQTPLSHSFCQHVVAANAPLVVEDARRHPLVRDNAAIDDLGVVAYAGCPLATADGQVLGAFCAIDTAPRAWTARELAILRDLAATAMTEIAMREQRRAMRESLTLQRTILDSARHIVLALDTTGTVRLFNRAAEEQLGYAAAEVVDQATPLLFHDREELAARAAEFSSALGRPIDAGLEVLLAKDEIAASKDMVWTIVRKDGSRFPAHISVSIWRATSGETLGFVAVAEDLTARLAAENERRAFIDAVAHDLKSPLTIVRAFAQIAMRQVRQFDEAQRGELREWLGTIDAQAGRIGSIIEELQDVVHLQAGQPLALDHAPLDLGALVAEVAATWRRSTERHAIEARTPGDGLVIRADRARLERVLHNLLSNAVKYSLAGGAISVIARCEEDEHGPWAVVEVRDRGLGIPADDLALIFTRFYRARNVGRIAGSGLGLVGARQIAMQHGGTLTAASVEGEGSTFTLRLPLDGTSEEDCA